MATKPFFRRRKSDPFEGKDAPAIDYKDTRSCSATSRAGQDRALAHHRVGAKNQRRLAQAIKRARFLRLLPYAVK
jgi:small subunit ribosomal protein S18